MVFPIRSICLDRCNLDVTNLILLGDFQKKKVQNKCCIFFSVLIETPVTLLYVHASYLLHNYGRKFEFNIVIVWNNFS